MWPVRELTRVSKVRGVKGAGILFAIVAIAGGVLAACWPFTQSKVLKSIRESWPGPVKAGRVHSVFFPYPGCIIENLVLALPSNRSREPALVTMKRARIQASYFGLILRPGYVTRLIVEGLRIEVPVYGQGR